MLPPLHTDLLKHLPDTHLPAGPHRREARRQRLAARRATMLALARRLAAAAERTTDALLRGVARLTGRSGIGMSR